MSDVAALDSGLGQRLGRLLLATVSPVGPGLSPRARDGPAGAEIPDPQYTPGSAADFDRLYADSYPRLVRTLRVVLRDWAEAEDVVQEAYVRAFRSWDKWRADAPAEAWLWRIAIRVVQSRARRRKLLHLADVFPRNAGEPEAGIEADPGLSRSTDIGRALDQLPAREAWAVVMRYLHGYSSAEIAVMLGVDVRTVSRILTRACTTLQAALAEAHSDAVQPEGAGGS